jgi:SET domain
MTEVRPSEKISDTSRANINHQVGLFATKDYSLGDCILVESAPLIQLSSINDSSISLLSKFEKDWIKTMMISDDTTTNPSNSDDKPDDYTKMMAMVEVALCMVLHLSKKSHTSLEWESDPVICDLRKLYRPLTTENDQTTQELSLITLSDQALLYVRIRLADFVSSKNRNSDDNILSGDDSISLQKFIRDTLLSTATGEPVTDSTDEKTLTLNPIIHDIMLIWACNAFDGGRIYDTFSRINHSCNPNSVVVIDSENKNQNNACQKLLAASTIAKGDEILISYLHGPFLYADVNTRQKLLLQDKYFTCTCSRCNESQPDIPSAIPCLQCYPREYSNSSTTTLNSGTTDAAVTRVLLSEDVQYDDDHNVHYQFPNLKLVVTESNFNGPEFQCSVCTTSSTGKKKAPPIDHQVRYYNKIYSTSQAIIDRVVAFLRHSRPNTMKNRDHQQNLSDETKSQEQPGDDLVEDQAIYLEQLEQLLRMSSSILGAKHWTTNMLMLHQLNHTLITFNTRSIMKLTSSSQQRKNNDDDDDDDVENTIAEAIDMLQRIERFVVGVTSLRLHMGHLLSDVVIGVARALVSLGDIKSQKYAAQWIEKILLYVNQFESPGKQTVVHSLHIAWQRDNAASSREENNSTAKRLKR